jgi:gliding motility-associated lipoprotein GldH
MKTGSLSNIVVIIASSLCFSCGNDTVYNKFQPVRDKVWDKQSEYYFKFEIKDLSIPYNILLQIRNNDMYGYQNLWLLCKQLQPDGALVKDTIECMLADDFGKWNGNGITLFQSRLTLHDHYIFPDTGQYTISIRHGMRDDNLKGIEDIGLFIEKAKLRR